MSMVTMNGADNTATTPTLSADESEESFVVLSPSLAPDNMESMMSYNSSMVNSAMIVSNTNSVIPKEVSQTISAMSLSATSELCPEEIHSKLESLLHENLQLKETLHQNNLAMKKQFTTLVAWQEDVMKVHQSHKEKFEETKNLIAHLRAENTELKKGSNSLPNMPENSVTNETIIINLKSKISALEFELDTLRQGYVKKDTEQNQKITELEAKLAKIEKEKEEQSKKDSDEIKNLRTELKVTTETLEVTQKRILELANKVPTIDHLQLIEKLTKEVQDLTADLDYKNKTLHEKTETVDKLEEENKKLNIENQTIPIYKTQVEVYQKDFNTERESRNALHEEKERLSNDLRHLQRRNQELIEELERVRDASGFVHVSPSTESAAETVREVPDYVCPKCSFLFTTYMALENHVYRCIELDQYP